MARRELLLGRVAGFDAGEGPAAEVPRLVRGNQPLMDLAIFLVLGVAAIVGIWWRLIPTPPAEKAVQMIVGFVGAGIIAVVFGGGVFGLCLWASEAIGHQPLH